VRAIPLGAALQLSRRALALGPDRFTHRRVLEILVGSDHPFTFALRILETE